MANIPGFELALAERLAGTSPDERGMGPDFDAPIFACHDSKPGAEITCAGWLASQGAAHPNVRLMVLRGEIEPEALKPSPEWPELHTSFADVIAEMREQTAELR